MLVLEFDLTDKKAIEVNQLLAGKCENGFDYIPHNNIHTRLHQDGLYRNRKGINLISYNFKDYFNNLQNLVEICKP